MSWNSAWPSGAAHSASKGLVYTASDTWKNQVLGWAKSFFSSQIVHAGLPDFRAPTFRRWHLTPRSKQLQVDGKIIPQEYSYHERHGGSHLNSSMWETKEWGPQLTWTRQWILVQPRLRVRSCLKNKENRFFKKLLSPEIRCECFEPFLATNVFPQEYDKYFCLKTWLHCPSPLLVELIESDLEKWICSHGPMFLLWSGLRPKELALLKMNY